MKKLFLLAGFYCLLLSTHAQSATSVKVDFSKKGIQTVDNINSPEASIAEANINSRAVRNFRSDYPDVKDEYWTIFPNKEILCRFRQSGVMTNIYYGKKGYRKLVIRGFNGDMLDRDVKERLRNYYAGYRIGYVNEINVFGQPLSYVVNIENCEGLKVVRISGDDMEVQKELLNP